MLYTYILHMGFCQLLDGVDLNLIKKKVAGEGGGGEVTVAAVLQPHVYFN